MTMELLSIIIFAGVLFVVCWMFTEYWIGVRNRGVGEKTAKPCLGSRTALALTHFWNTVDEAGDIPNETLKKEMSLVNRSIEDCSLKEVRYSIRHVDYTKEVEVSKKKYKIKENM